MILNLQSNALKFTERGSVIIKARVYDSQEDQFLEVSVVDTGAGIKDEDKDKLFKMFGYI